MLQQRATAVDPLATECRASVPGNGWVMAGGHDRGRRARVRRHVREHGAGTAFGWATLYEPLWHLRKDLQKHAPVQRATVPGLHRAGQKELLRVSGGARPALFSMLRAVE